MTGGIPAEFKGRCWPRATDGSRLRRRDWSRVTGYRYSHDERHRDTGVECDPMSAPAPKGAHSVIRVRSVIPTVRVLAIAGAIAVWVWRGCFYDCEGLVVISVRGL